MKPYYQDEAVIIYHADCREVMPLLPKVDLMLTDPPYGIGIASNPFRQRHAKKDWDDKPVDRGTLLAAIALGRKSIVWGGNYFSLPAHQCFLVWDKEQPEAFSGAMVEQAWTNLEGPAKMFRMRVVSYRKDHPTAKPIELMTWCISRAGDPTTILDPFMGSGTVLRAAKDLGRKAVGIEIEESYCEVAAMWCRQEVLCVPDIRRTRHESGD